MPCERKHIEAIEKILDREINYIDPASELSLRAVINAAIAACDESPWRSMDTTAPDGIDVLLWCPHEVVPKMVVGYYWEQSGFLADDGEPMSPTHWMPLPAAPEVGK